MNKRHLSTALALGAVATLALAGCSSASEPSGDQTDASGDMSCETVTLGFLPSWTDGLSTAYLLQNQLGALGIDVEMQTLTEAGPLYAGLAQGDVDIYPSAWPELTHASYMEEYGDNIEDLDAYYEGAKLTIAVPDYVDITSIEDLAGNADRFGGRIVGIEPGAGLTAQTQDVMMPAYGLDGEYELVTSSTAAMLTELEAATNAGENVVVTLWEPHWAYGAYPIKNLDDPEGALGGTESLHSYGRTGFADDFPEVAEWLGNFQMDLETLYSLENLLFVENDTDDYGPLVEQWISENQAYVDGLTS